MRTSSYLAAPSGLLVTRVVGALALRRSTYADVAADVGAGFQAGIVVVLCGLLEMSVYGAIHGEPNVGTARLLYATSASMVGWLLWSGLVYGVGVRAFGHEAELGPVLRAIGFAHVPGLVFGLGAIPGFQIAVGSLYVLTLFWFVGTLLAAIRGVLGVTLGQSAGIAVTTMLVHEVIRQALRGAGAVS